MSGFISLHSEATSCPKGTSYCVSNTSFIAPPVPTSRMTVRKEPAGGFRQSVQPLQMQSTTNRNWLMLPRRGESRFARRTRRSCGRFVNRPYDATIRQSGKLEYTENLQLLSWGRRLASRGTGNPSPTGWIAWQLGKLQSLHSSGNQTSFPLPHCNPG